MTTPKKPPHESDPAPLAPEQPAGPNDPAVALPQDADPAEVIRAAVERAGAAGAAGNGAAGSRRLPARRPAEFSALVTAVGSLGAYFGIDQAAGILYAGLGVAATLPFAVSAMVD